MLLVLYLDCILQFYDIKHLITKSNFFFFSQKIGASNSLVRILLNVIPVWNFPAHWKVIETAYQVRETETFNLAAPFTREIVICHTFIKSSLMFILGGNSFRRTFFIPDLKIHHWLWCSVMYLSYVLLHLKSLETSLGCPLYLVSMAGNLY